jgi:DNA transformation protein
MSGSKLRNVGPKSAAWLRQVGVRTQKDLVEHGPVGAFMKVKRAGFRPSLNLLYSLEGAIVGCHWQEVPIERRELLQNEVAAAEAALPPAKGRPGPVTMTEGPAMHAGEDAGDAQGVSADAGFGLDDPAADTSLRSD